MKKYYIEIQYWNKNGISIHSDICETEKKIRDIMPELMDEILHNADFKSMQPEPATRTELKPKPCNK